MTRSPGHRLTVAIILIVASIFFIPVFAEAVAGFSYTGPHAEHLERILSPLPLLVALVTLFVFMGLLEGRRAA